MTYMKVDKCGNCGSDHIIYIQQLHGWRCLFCDWFKHNPAFRVPRRRPKGKAFLCRAADKLLAARAKKKLEAKDG